MWPWKLEIALLLGIQVSPSESMRKVMSPPSLGGSAAQAVPNPTAGISREAAATAEVVSSRRRRERDRRREGLVIRRS
jgi:hypothetical protein